MKLLKNFKDWLKNLSTKTTIILTGIGITLFMAMQQAFVGALATGGGGDIYLMSFTLWLAVMFITLFFSILLLLVGYSLGNVKEKYKNQRKIKEENNKKEKQ